MSKVSVATLKEAVAYDRETGEFSWLLRPDDHFSSGAKWSAAHSAKRWNTRYAGKNAFTQVSAQGYLTGVVCNVRLLAHRVAWAIETGEWPSLSVDHINGVRTDNRLCNLRLATRQEQNRNTTSARGSTSGFLGVSYRKDRGVWRANIFIFGRQTFLGSFETEFEAAKAYDLAAKAHFGDFARLNFP